MLVVQMVSSKSLIASVLHSAATQLNILSVTHVMTEGWYLKFKCIYSYNAKHVIILACSFIRTCVCHLLQDSPPSLNIKLYRN